MSNCWYFDKEDLLSSPSRFDNIDHATEVKYRIAGARFIIETGTKMDLGYNTIATGVVYFHRFYMLQSFKNFPHYVTACCCLYLAGKVEETPKRCHDIIKIAKCSLSPVDFATFGHNPKEEVTTLERILLQTIKFDLQVEHPYSFLLKYAKSLRGNKDQLEKMVQMSWTFINDSLSTTLCLQWEPEIIAVSLMYLAGKLSRFEVVDWKGRTPQHLKWWDSFIEGVTVELIEDVCHQVLDLYSPGQPLNKSEPQSPSTQSSCPESTMSQALTTFKTLQPTLVGNGGLKIDITKPPPRLPTNQNRLTMTPPLPPPRLPMYQDRLTMTPPLPPPLLPMDQDRVTMTPPLPTPLLPMDQDPLTTSPPPPPPPSTPPPIDQAHLPPLPMDEVHLTTQPPMHQVYSMPPPLPMHHVYSTPQPMILDPFVKSSHYWCNEAISVRSFK